MNSPVTRAIVPAAGLGTRLLSVTKEQPKEMLAVFSKGRNRELSMKPVVQLIFEQLFDCGIRVFCFVVGRGKRAIEDHFTPDQDFVDLLRARGRIQQVQGLRAFYSRVSKSKIYWVNQAEPRGFGHSVLCAETISGAAPVLVHAGDNQVISPNNDHLRRLLQVQQRTDADATLLLRHTQNPRQYGVAETTRRGDEVLVRKVVEKPERPPSNLALLPAYVFKPVIFDALRNTKPGKGGEIQLTDGVQVLIDRGFKVNAVQLREGEFWLDVGTPETYWEALSVSHKMYSRR